jgi:putative Holliday junction resolvase
MAVLPASKSHNRENLPINIPSTTAPANHALAKSNRPVLKFPDRTTGAPETARPAAKRSPQTVRMMALDIGTKRVGVAMSDEMGWTAQPLEVVPRRPEAGFVRRVKELIDQHQVRRLILGLPVRLDGTVGPEAQAVLQLAERLKTDIDVPIETWDERLTTTEAEDVLLEADVSRKKRKQVIDKIAAALILKSYLEAAERTGGPGCAEPS